MKLDHMTIHSNNLEAVKESLMRLLLLEDGPRPAFEPYGYWLYGEGYPIVHLTAMDTNPGDSTGALDHVSFKDDDYDGLKSRLQQDAVEYREQVVPGTGVRQVFFIIQHQVEIEVDFPPAP